MHRFQYEDIRRACKEEYPKLTSEQQSQDTRGLVALFRDHLIDLPFLDSEGAVPSQATDPGQKGAKDEESGSKDEEGVRVDEKVVPS